MADKNYQLQTKGADGQMTVVHPETTAEAVIETTERQFLSQTEKTKLGGIAPGAQVNVIESVQVDGVTVPPAGKTVNLELSGKYIPVGAKGAANGVAGLDGTGKVPAAQLPSYVDDVLEYASETDFPQAGEDGKIYIAKDTNIQYRWSGTQYVQISSSLALGETSSTAYPGDKGKKNATDIATLQTAQSTTAGKVTQLEDGTVAAGKANKLTAARTVTLTGAAGGSTSFDGSANVTLPVTLTPTGVAAGTYSALTVGADGRATAGAQVLEVGQTGQTEPSASLAVGGLFLKEV